MDLLQSLLVRRQGKETPVLTSIDGRNCSEIMAAGGGAARPQWQDVHLRQAAQLSMLAPFGDPDQPLEMNENLPPSGQQDQAIQIVEELPLADLDNMLSLQSMDDFDGENPYVTRPKLVPVVSRKPNGELATKFQHLCDQHGVKPVWTVEEVSAYRFVGKVQIGSESIGIDEPKPSKKLAKEEVCKLAIARMPHIEKMDLGVEKKRGTKRKKSETTQDFTPSLDKSENWIGILCEYAQQHKLDLPEFQEFQTETTPHSFACSVTISDHPTEFGSDLDLSSTKKDAKAAAARAAVLHLRSQGKLRSTLPKRQRTASIDLLVMPGHTGLTQAVYNVDMHPPAATSLAQRVHNLTSLLGFNTPRFDCRPSLSASGEPIPLDASFYDVAAYFDERDVVAEPRLKGPIGEVEHIYGIKKAKKECWERVLGVLEGIQRDRIA